MGLTARDIRIGAIDLASSTQRINSPYKFLIYNEGDMCFHIRCGLGLVGVGLQTYKNQSR